jgi:hypothetical protein
METCRMDDGYVEHVELDDGDVENVVYGWR